MQKLYFQNDFYFPTVVDNNLKYNDQHGLKKKSFFNLKKKIYEILY